ncbi:MAG: hypothetical protein QF369_05560, partial [Dehalococcoidales bacterium]|nr:hypothetical protein [Dehalococcoidales bacterium]
MHWFASPFWLQRINYFFHHVNSSKANYDTNSVLFSKDDLHLYTKEDYAVKYDGFAMAIFLDKAKAVKA